MTSTYGAQRLLGTHQPFEDDLTLRPDWIPFASPFYLIRAGAVGVYGGLHPSPRLSLEVAELNLMLLMTGFVKAFSSVGGFRQFLEIFGTTEIK